MLLEPLRNWVKKLESELIKLKPEDSRIIRRCARGDTDAFRDEFLIPDPQDEEDVGWETAEHGQFYVACQKLKDAEESELKAAFASAR